jgi:hypothetical protein
MSQKMKRLHYLNRKFESSHLKAFFVKGEEMEVYIGSVLSNCIFIIFYDAPSTSPILFNLYHRTILKLNNHLFRT